MPKTEIVIIKYNVESLYFIEKDSAYDTLHKKLFTNHFKLLSYVLPIGFCNK